MSRWSVPAALALSFVLGLSGCAAGSVAGGSAPGTPGGAGTVAATGAPPTAPVEVPTAREGRPADSQRVEFVPERVELPGRASAAVVPAATVGGVLQVPENVQHVGWWDGSAYAGSPFGSTVIAGHVDSATQGIGFFARLLQMRVGEEVSVSAGGHRQRYRITSVQTVLKQALASDSQAFDQDGPHRLVLITCSGAYHPERGGYDSNLVVVGRPLGLAR